jgi:hypothetical protein
MRKQEKPRGKGIEETTANQNYLDKINKIKKIGDTIADFVVNTGIADAVLVFDRDCYHSYPENGFVEFYQKLQKLVNLGGFDSEIFEEIFELITQSNWELMIDLVWVGLIEKLHETEKGKKLLRKIYGEAP